MRLLLPLLLLLLLDGARAQNVAMIIGEKSIVDDIYLRSVELFGCPGGQTPQISDYPHDIYLTGAGLFEDEITGEAFVLACGGLECYDCLSDQDCYEYRPESLGNTWIPSSRLMRPRSSHLMVKASVGGRIYPSVVGFHQQSERLDWDTMAWEDFGPRFGIPSNFWLSWDCFLQDPNSLDIYNVDLRAVYKLDISEGRFYLETLTDYVPANMTYTPKCSLVAIQGQEGLFLPNGYFFNLETRTWDLLAPLPPPENDLAVDAMWTLNGVPTVFGYPLCHTTEADYNCYRFGVMQYDGASDQWDLVGLMEEDRTYHEVVEVPQAFCDYASV